MKAALSESTALSQKSEREYVTLRDSIKGLVESWKADTERLREEMQRREDKVRAEAESVGRKYKKLLEEVQTAETGRAEVKKYQELDKKTSREVEQVWQEEISRLKVEVEKSNRETEDATALAKQVPLE